MVRMRWRYSSHFEAGTLPCQIRAILLPSLQAVTHHGWYDDWRGDGVLCRCARCGIRWMGDGYHPGLRFEEGEANGEGQCGGGARICG